MLRLTIYSKPGCHLCEEMKTVIARVSRTIPLALEEIDISTDPRLDAQYGLEIPVLAVEGQKMAKYRIEERDLLRMLQELALRTGDVNRAAKSGGAGRSGGEGG